MEYHQPPTAAPIQVGVTAGVRRKAQRGCGRACGRKLRKRAKAELVLSTACELKLELKIISTNEELCQRANCLIWPAVIDSSYAAGRAGILIALVVR